MSWQPRRPSAEQLAKAKAVAAILVGECHTRLSEVEQALGVKDRRDLAKVVEIAKGWGVTNFLGFHTVDRKRQRSLRRIWKLAPGLGDRVRPDAAGSALLDVDRLDRIL